MKTKTEKELIEYFHSVRFVTVIFVLMGLLFTIGWIILVENENHIVTLKPESVVVSDASGYRFNVENISWKKDDISITEDYVCISGWLLKQGQQVDKVEIRVLLRNLNTGEYLVLPTDVIERSDVTEYINDGKDYNYCGFSVKIPYWDELDTTDYEVLAQYALNDDPRVYISLCSSLKGSAEEVNNE